MNFKRLQLSLAVLFTVGFTLMSSSIVSASTTDYTSSLKRMQELGIIDSSATNTSSYIIRGELVKSIVISLGKSQTAGGLKGSTIFPDVDSTGSLSGYINEGVSLGTEEGINQNVVCGRADGYFHPNDTVTYGEFCTMMVRLLGYSDSDLKGAWPNNYIQKAADLDLTNDLNLSRSDRITTGVEAVIFERLFDSTMKVSGNTSSFFSDNYYNDATTTGNLVEAIVLGNSSTSASLGDNQILTDKGTYTLGIGARTPEVGGKYKLYIDGSTVTKVAQKVNTLEYYAVYDVSGKTIVYTDENGNDSSMTLPKASAYYYQGQSISYAAAVKSIQAYSSITLAKDSNGNNSYIVVTDPVFSSPLAYESDYDEIDDLLSGSDYDYIYKDGDEYDDEDDLSFDDEDVVYKVSDLWGRNSFIYIYDHEVSGEITSVSPSTINPESITISVEKENGSSSTQTVTVTNPDGTTSTTTTRTNNSSSSSSPSTCSISKYFDRTKLALNDDNELAEGNYVTLILDIYGEVIDIY